MTEPNTVFHDNDISEYLIHLVGKDDSYNQIMSILSAGVIKAKKSFGFKSFLHKKKSICFSEIPPKYLAKLVKRRSNFGIAFKKQKLLGSGAQRVWYVDKGSVQHNALNQLYNLSTEDIEHQLEVIFPFIDIAGEYENSSYQFQWEREWRLLGDFCFKPDDVAFLIIPANRHQDARGFFNYAEAENLGPNYQCRYIDPLSLTETLD
ncbi:abortive infection system antitoxin AbiGi family protein [Photobacterium sagamiensis]|uniref:abortive infection system antitoxin AbiGi family protein n=1 Tax=Photobacterium sagamiensis TaxID=2910241 RepID=UPI003D0AC546